MPRTASDLSPTERTFLLDLQTLACHYFLDNQVADGLILDRQHNFGPRQSHGWRSIAATGMGLIALALASAEPVRLLTRHDAIGRVGQALKTALERLPHTRGILPHFTNARGAAVGFDVCSTVDTAWLIGGGLWAATYLGDASLQILATQLYDRIDWRYWTTSFSPNPGLIRHGSNAGGQLLPCAWDRLNGETIFLYVLAAGADAGRAWAANGWSRLRPFFSTVAGRRFVSADLGLFVFQYGLDLLDLETWRAPGDFDLMTQAAMATEANFRFCRTAAERFRTYRHHWGLSAGDGPGPTPDADTYRCYAPGQPLDGTAHLTATLAAVAHAPELVLENLTPADRDVEANARGRYGFSNINLDRQWVARDMVGIDAGAAVLALDNFLMGNRVRRVFHTLPCVVRGLQRLGFTPGTEAAVNEEEIPEFRLAS